MEVPYYRIKGRGDLYSIVHEKGVWTGVFQGYITCESCNWIILFSNKHGIREFTKKDKYFLLETKTQGDQRKMERRALLLLLRKVTGDPTFTTEIMDHV